MVSPRPVARLPDNDISTMAPIIGVGPSIMESEPESPEVSSDDNDLSLKKMQKLDHVNIEVADDGDDDEDEVIFHDEEGEDEEEDYESLDEDDDSSDDESPEMREEFRRYTKQIVKSRGFDVDFLPKGSFLGGIFPLNMSSQGSKEYVAEVHECMQFVINKYNKKKYPKKLELVRIVKANIGMCSRCIYYITFEGKDSASGMARVYQTSVHYGIRKKLAMHSFRLKPREQVDILSSFGPGDLSK